MKNGYKKYIHGSSFHFKTIFPPIEQHIGSRPGNSIFRDRPNRTIIKLIPFIFILSIGRIMASPEPSIMVAHRIEFVFGFGLGLAVLGFVDRLDVLVLFFKLGNVRRYWCDVD